MPTAWMRRTATSVSLPVRTHKLIRVLKRTYYRYERHRSPCGGKQSFHRGRTTASVHRIVPHFYLSRVTARYILRPSNGLSDNANCSRSLISYPSYACWYRDAVRIETTIDTMQQSRKIENHRTSGSPLSEEIETADNATT